MSERYDIVIDQGSAFGLEIDLFDDNNVADLQTYTAAGKLKKHYTSTNSYVFTCDVANGVLSVTMSSDYTSNITPGRYVYDIETYLNGNTALSTRVVEGVAVVTPSVTS